MIFTSCPIARNLDNYYFEMNVVDQGENAIIGIGLSHWRVKPLTRNGRMPGWDFGSIGYHADDGGIFHADGRWKHSCATYGSGDTVGCMLVRARSEKGLCAVAYFTKNGSKSTPLILLEDDDYHPSIGIASIGAKVTANLGTADFLYKYSGKGKYRICT